MGLTPAQCGVLTVLRILRGLEGRCQVARVPAPDNPRNLSVSLSATGAVLLAAAQEPAEQACQRLLALAPPSASAC